MKLDFAKLVPKVDAVLARGLSNGLGEAGKQVCVEAAICEVLGLPHGDDPGCVVSDVRAYKIRLNDSNWSSPDTRARGLRDLAIAQLGTKDVLKPGQFSKLMAEKAIRALIPTLFREVLKNDVRAMAAADRCEKEGTREAAFEAQSAAAYACAPSAYVCAATAAASYAGTPAYAAVAAYTACCVAGEKYLLLSAKLALEALRELGAPGVAYL